jgi:hypothetical protein
VIFKLRYNQIYQLKTTIAMIPSINLIVTGATDKTMFFFKFVTSDKGIDMNPIRCIKLDEVAINFEWVSYGVRISYFLLSANGVGYSF